MNDQTRREIRRCGGFFGWRHVLVHGLDRHGHPAWVCANCPKAYSQYGADTCDGSPKQPQADVDAYKDLGLAFRR